LALRKERANHALGKRKAAALRGLPNGRNPCVRGALLARNALGPLSFSPAAGVRTSMARNLHSTANAPPARQLRAAGMKQEDVERVFHLNAQRVSCPALGATRVE
jgi:hypothetical protein